MPPFPGLEERTVGEVHRELVAVKEDDESAKRTANERLQGYNYPRLSIKDLHPQELLLDPVPLLNARGVHPKRAEDRQTNAGALRAGDQASTSGRVLSPWTTTIRLYVDTAVKAVIRAAAIPVAEDAGRKVNGPLRSLSWHSSKQWLAVLGPHDRILLYDLESKGGAALAPGILMHEFQRHVTALEWRPYAGGGLAVTCKSGICLWTLSPPVSLSPQAVSTPGRVTLPLPYSRQRKPVAATMVLLRAKGHKQAVALSWSPDGRLLAAAYENDPTIIIWDVATGSGTPLRRGLAGVNLLKWSPTGDYLVTATNTGTFYLWETELWTSEPWASGSGAMVAAADWSPDGQVLLAAFEGTTTLAAIHFAGRPPSLDAHLIPIELPEVEAAATSGAGTLGPLGMELMAWDGSGERLAVSYKAGDEHTKGLVAIYDTRRTPVLATSLVGFIRGPAEGVTPLSFSFHHSFQRGALLAVGWSDGQVVIYPLLFRASSLH